MDSTRNAQKASLEATRALQKARIDATRAVQQHNLDSARKSRQQILDQTKAARQKITDSLTAIRKYRESKRYKDSVLKSRQAKVDAIRSVQKARFDSVRAIQKHVTDSAIAVRKRSTDSLRAIQKKRTDSLAVIRKYRESKRFKDSVIVVRRVHMDSVRAVRKTYNDSVFAVRKHVLDSAKAERKRVFDSSTASRTRILDSVKAVRKVKADSLAKVKADREKQVKEKEKKNELLANMKFELKIKNKRQKYSNDKMLKKKWSVPRQIVQNTFTRYNYYFNARRKMDEAELNMQRVAKDNFNERIALFSFDPNRDSTLLLADMDSIIQKASLGIQIHDPRTKWGDDLYLLLGEAYYYKGSYANADASFRYIVAMRAKELKDKAQRNAYSNRTVRGTGKKEVPSVVEEDKKGMLEFLKHESANNEALLWVARTATQSGNYESAESVLDILGADAKFPENLKGRLALEKGFLALKQSNNKEAARQLAIVAVDKEQQFWIRRRAAFLAGQLFEQERNYKAAAEQYAHVTDLQPKIEMDFYARKNRANSLMLAGGDPKEAIASLKSMLTDGKYANYNEQIYYILGQLSVNANNLADAENYLRKSINAPRTTRRQKAVSYVSLGNIYYNAGKWDNAKNAYDSAARFGGGSPDDTAILLARRRAQVLDEVSGPERSIRSKDSLLALSAMTEREQKAVIRRYIRNLERQREDSATQAANAGLNPTQGTDAGNNEPGAMTWYFSNAGLTQQGFNEFKRKWGNRPLTDNWQRAAAVGAAGRQALASTDAGDDATTVSSGDQDLEATLYGYIPHNQQDRDRMNQQIQRAYVDLGTAYTKSLDDYTRSNAAMDTLDRRYPVNIYNDEALYVRYLTALRANRLPSAQQYSTELQQKYPQSKWAKMLRPADDTSTIQQAGNQASVTNFYDETYQLLLQRDYNTALRRSVEGRQRYSDPVYGNRFRIMEAIAYAGRGSYRQADTLLNEFIKTNQNDSLRIWAENVQRYVQGQIKADTLNIQKPLDSATRPATIVPPSSVPVARNSATDTVAAPAAFSYKPSEPHYFVFFFNTMSTKVAGVRGALTDFNSLKFSGQNLDAAITMLQAGQAGLVVVRSFANAGQAKVYLNEFRRNGAITREFAQGEYSTFIISASNFLKIVADREVQTYLNFYKNKY